MAVSLAAAGGDEYWKWLRAVPRSQRNIRRIRLMGLPLNGLIFFRVSVGSVADITDMMWLDS